MESWVKSFMDISQAKVFFEFSGEYLENSAVFLRESVIPHWCHDHPVSSYLLSGVVLRYLNVKRVKD